MRVLLWGSMLDAEMNLRYWDEAMRRHLSREQRLRITQMILSSGTVAAWWLWLGADWIWKLVSMLAAGLSVYLYVAGTSKPAEKLAGLRRAYASCLVEYEHLWSRLENGGLESDLQSRLEVVRRQQYEQTADEPHFPYDKELLAACHAAVCVARKLERGGMK